MVAKKTRNKEYFQYLVKWNNQQVEDATWVTEQRFQNMVQY